MKRILRRVKMNLTKKLGKSLLKCVVFIILFSMLFTSLYIQNIANNLENNIISKFDIYIEIDPNIFYGEVTQEQQKNETIEYVNIIEDIKNNTDITYFDFNIRSNFKSPIKIISIFDDELIIYDRAMSISNGMPIYNYQNHQDNILSFNNQSLITPSIKGAYSALPKDFELGNAIIKNGRTFSEDEIKNGEAVCIIEDKKMANLSSNGARMLEVGDVITISEIIQDENGAVIYYQPHEFRVVGTYEVAEGRKIQSDGISTGERPIYIPEKQFQNIYESVSKEAMEYDSNYFENIITRYELDNALFKVETIKDYQNFLNYLDNYAEEFNNGYKYVSTMDDLYPSISSVLAVSNTISYISIICLIVCIAITIIIILFEIDASRKDIGILLSMGESIKGVVTQFVLEMILISLLSISISFVFTQKIGTEVLSTIVKENVTEEVLKDNNLDMAIESNEYDEILKPLTVNDSIQSIVFYVIGIEVFQSILVYVLVKKIDPKELMKDE